MPISEAHCGDSVIHLSSASSMLSSAGLTAACPAQNNFRLAADRGQRLNVSLWSFGADRQRSRGVLRDQLSGNTAELAASSRHQQLMTTLGNVAELTVNKREPLTSFLLDVKGMFWQTTINFCAVLIITHALCCTCTCRCTSHAHVDVSLTLTCTCRCIIDVSLYTSSHLPLLQCWVARI